MFRIDLRSEELNPINPGIRSEIDTIICESGLPPLTMRHYESCIFLGRVTDLDEAAHAAMKTSGVIVAEIGTASCSVVRLAVDGKIQGKPRGNVISGLIYDLITAVESRSHPTLSRCTIVTTSVPVGHCDEKTLLQAYQDLKFRRIGVTGSPAETILEWRADT